MSTKVRKEEIDSFLSGSNPMKHIIKIEGDYNDEKIYVIYRDDNGNLRTQIDDFYPFVWCKQSAARGLFNGNRTLLKEKMVQYGIGCKGLKVDDYDGNIHPRMENGYRIMFFARRAMTYSAFMRFFEEAGRPIFPKQKDINYGIKEYITVSPVEQYMIHTGKRLFKGYDDYDDLTRLIFDLETEGLDPKINAISQIGIRTNKGYEKIITVKGSGEEKQKNEISALTEFFQIIYDIKPDVVLGYNSENFDFYFIDERLKLRGSSLLEFTKDLFYGQGIYKKNKQQVLKLGGEMEYYVPTIMWGHNIVDCLFSVRRAQAIDSNMKSATLKYVTKYSKLNKPDRVYVPGKVINSTWEDETKTYAFNNENGHWFKVDEKLLGKTYVDDNGNECLLYTNVNDEKLINNKTGEEFRFESGRYIVERYLLDDLWETDKVELRYNQPNFLVGKMLPVNYEKMCTMGTAAIWKYIMLAWSYEHGLAIPELIDTHSFTGGLSRLLEVGYVDRIVKLDYNSLYPSILLTFNINSPVDIQGVMLALLEYILTQREHYKDLKAIEGGKAKEIKKLLASGNIIDAVEIERLKDKQKEHEIAAARNDKMQLPLKIIGNGFFGSYGSGSVFPWSDLECAEETTCCGRQMLRLMISHFTNLGYKPIVGDSFTGDTPLFIKYKHNNFIDIKTIKEIIDENEIKIDALGREYDYSEKPYKVLSRNGWQDVKYVYRHKTDKDIYKVEDNETIVEVTEDHSLFNNKKEKIKPSEITENTKLEYYSNEVSNIFTSFNTLGNSSKLKQDSLKFLCKSFADRINNSVKINRMPPFLLNSCIEVKKCFIELINFECLTLEKQNKATIACINFIKKCIENA